MWCDSCKRHVSAPCTSHHLTVDTRGGVCRRFRSTKGASKARRDHINCEIRNMRTLLPISQEDQERLSYLHSMAAICTYIRKSVLFQGLPAGQRSDCSLPYEAFLPALHGFILVTTAQGRLVYVSENVTEYMGHSMVDVLQGDTVYDMVDHSDVDIVKSNLDINTNSATERSFVCCMQTSKAFRLQHGSCCSMLIRGSFQRLPQSCPASSSSSSASSSASPTEELLFVALCTPTVNRLRSEDAAHFCQSFSSVHRPDMTFTQLSDSVSYFLGYSVEEMEGRSWYSLLHPEHVSSGADSHKSLMQADEGSQVEMVLRLQRKDLSWIWVYVRATKDSECQGILCSNYVISETEARFLMQKINSDAFRPSTETYSCSSAGPQMPQTQSSQDLTQCSKRQRTSNSQSEGPSPKTRRVSEDDVYYVACASSQDDVSPVHMRDSPDLFTPPYSPASSTSPLQKDEFGSDFLMGVHGYTDQLSSSPEGSPSYYSYPEAGPTLHYSPSQSPLGQSIDHRAMSMTSTHSPDSSLSPTYDFQDCTANARLVPDCLSVSDICESPVDCVLRQDDFSLLEQPQGGSSSQVHYVPHSVHSSFLTPNPSPTSQDSFRYNEREQVEISILAQQISSLARSFDMYRTLSPVQKIQTQSATETQPSNFDWPQRATLSTVLPVKPELLLDDGVFDSILKDLNMATLQGRTSGPSVVSYSYQQGLVCGRTHRLDQEAPSLSPAIPEDSLPSEQFTPANIAMDNFTLQLGSHDQNTGLHQLNHFMHSSLQQELTVPWESAVEEAFERKSPKYTELAADAEQRGWKAKVCPVEVGCRGFVGKSTIRLLKDLGIRGQAQRQPIKALSDTDAFQLRKEPSSGTFIRNLHQEPSSGAFIRNLHQEPSSGTFIRSLHQEPSSGIFIRSLHQEPSSGTFIRSLHQEPSSGIFIRSLHQEPSSGIFIRNLHQESSSGAFIRNLHQEPSSGIFIRSLHQEPSSRAFIRNLHHEPSSGAFIRNIHQEPSSGTFIRSLHQEPSSGTFIRGLHQEPSSGIFIRSLHQEPSSGTFIRNLHQEPSSGAFIRNLHQEPSSGTFIRSLHQEPSSGAFIRNLDQEPSSGTFISLMKAPDEGFL
ncbi:neuronal PAS domain-containing protein 4-like [Diretmus argenteus]